MEKRFIPLGNMETNPRYEGFYEASNLGRIKSVDRIPGEAEACRRFGLLQGKIRRAIQMGWKCRGYVWKYYNEGTEGSTTIEPWLGFSRVVE